MPERLLWKRTVCSSGEKELPPTRVVAMNCSMVYCRTARFDSWAACACAKVERQARAASAMSESRAPRAASLKLPSPGFNNLIGNHPFGGFRLKSERKRIGHRLRGRGQSETTHVELKRRPRLFSSVFIPRRGAVAARRPHSGRPLPAGPRRPLREERDGQPDAQDVDADAGQQLLERERELPRRRERHHDATH